MGSVAVIVIGRNEGDRLRRSLESLIGQGLRLVYVDSGSTDGSLDLARAMGVQGVALDPSTPFTAARARNAGAAALGDMPDYLQFIDGDCQVVPGWIAAGAAALDGDPGLGLVTGWRGEVAPLTNAYHAMAEVEWRRPAGPIDSCGGDLMVRAGAFARVGGFDPGLICSEDEDFVIRIRGLGLRAERLPLAMTRHDMNMSRLSQWWRRNLRSGHGFAEVGDRHPPHFRAERRRALAYGLALPVLALTGIATGVWPLWALAALAYALSFARVLRWLNRDRPAGVALPRALAARVAGLFTLAKVPQALGMLRFWARGGARARPQLIEYK